jgi:hypothetical protein
MSSPAVAASSTPSSRDIFIAYGASGFHFDRPGEYRIRAVYQGHGDVLVPSNTLRIRIGAPLSQEANRMAQDYFSDQVGLSLYLQGSRSPFLSKGVDVLQELANHYKDSMLGAKIATALANGVSRPFFRVSRDALRHRQRTQLDHRVSVPGRRAQTDDAGERSNDRRGMTATRLVGIPVGFSERAGCARTAATLPFA